MTRAFVLSLALLACALPAAAQAPETFNGCFVPSVGAFYLIKRTGLPSACVATGHIEVTWTSGGTLADGSVTAVKVADGAIVTIKIADGAVSGAKLADASVTSAKIAGAAVGTGQIADGAVVAAKLGADVGSTILGNNSVTTAKIADGAVTVGKLGFDPATQAELDAVASTAGTVTSVTAGTGLTGGTITGSGTLAVAFGGDGSAPDAARSDHYHGSLNTVIQPSPNLHGNDNVVIGSEAMAANFIGNENVAIGYKALNAVVTGSRNVGVGAWALAFNTAADNIAIGKDALFSNTSGTTNTAIGSSALRLNQTASNNTAIGVAALYYNTAGGNTAVGARTLDVNTSGTGNVAIGPDALGASTTGGSNIAIGQNAGSAVSTGSNNIHVGTSGVAGDAGIIRIGVQGTQVKTFIAGISGVTTDAAAVPAFVSTTGQLGVTSSSRRYKQDISDLGAASRRVLDLRPVSFRYKQPLEDGSPRLLDYGLIAEEVAESFPELAVTDSTGRAETVRYHILPVLLLNELQRQERVLDALLQTTATQAAALDSLRTELRTLKHND